MTGCSAIYRQLGGPYKGSPASAFSDRGLGPAAKSLVNRAFDGLEGSVASDYHVHFFGNGLPKKYEYCTELNLLSESLRPFTNFEKVIGQQPWWQRPFYRGVYLSTIAVADENWLDDEFMRRLVDLVSAYGPAQELG